MAKPINLGNGRWRVFISAGFDEAGKRKRPSQVYRVDPTKSLHAQEQEVLKQAKIYEADMIRGLRSASNKITVNKLAADWIAGYVQRNKLAPRTQAQYRDLLEGRILPRMGRLYVQDIRPQHIEAFMRWLEQESPKTARGKGEKLSGTTCRKYYTLLLSLFKFAVKQQHIMVNPVDAVTPPREDTAEKTIYTQEQIEAFIQALDREPIRWRAYFYLALMSQMRRGELIALSWDDINLRTGELMISKSAFYLPGQGVQLKAPKTASGKRSIKIPLRVCALLEEHKREQGIQRLKMGSEWTDTGAVFTQWNGKHLHLDSPSKRMREIIERNSLPPITPHSLRHTGASLMIASGEDYVTVQHRLGHSRASTTLDIYAHHINHRDAEAAANLDSLIFEGQKRAK